MGRVWAALQAEASLSTTQMATGEPFQLTVQVSTDKKEELPWPDVKGLEPFTVTKNAATTSGAQTTVVNGRITRGDYFITAFTFTLTAKLPGTYTIGPIHYVHGTYDQVLGSATVTVTKSEAGLTTHASLSKPRAYVGEQVLYNLRIIPKAGVQQINLPEDMQKLIGGKFFFQRLDKNIAAKSATVEGQSVKVFDIPIALFPLLAGTAALEGIPVQYQQVQRARQRGGSMFELFNDDFFGGARVVNQTAIAQPLWLEILPLPTGAPGGFTGSVGEYSISASLDKASANVGDAVTVTVVIRGNGQPKSITKPAMPDLHDFEVFDPEETTTSSLQGATLWTTKTFKYVMIPRRQGSYVVEGVSFPYFDPKRSAYSRASAASLVLQVSPGKEGTVSAYNGRALSQSEIAELGSDIRHIKTGMDRLNNEGDLPYQHGWFAGLFLISPLGFAAAFVLRRRRDRLQSDAAFLRRSQADTQLRRRLKGAKEAMTAGEPKEFYRVLAQAINGYASDKLNLEFLGMTLPEARDALISHGAKPDSASAYETLAQRCDFAQFGGLKPTSQELQTDLDGAEKLLESLEGELT